MMLVKRVNRPHALSFVVTLLAFCLIYTTQPTHAEDKACVQLIESAGLLTRVITVDTRTGSLFEGPSLLVPPDALYSPDKKYAVFWRQNYPKDEMYLGSVADNRFALLVKEVPEPKSSNSIGNVHYWDELRAWSPDSSKFAYVHNGNNQYRLIVVNADGTNKHSQLILPTLSPLLKYPLWFIGIVGWSADSEYIATYSYFDPQTKFHDPWIVNHATIQVWRSDLSKIETEIAVDTPYFDHNVIATWSPTGHRLALQPFSVPEMRGDFYYGTKIAIWSPEHGIEADNTAQAPAVLRQLVHYLSWSPDGTYLRLLMSGSHLADDLILGIRGKHIFAETEQLRRFEEFDFNRTSFVGWTTNGSALMLAIDRNVTASDDEDSSQLYLLNVNTGTHRVLERNAFEPEISSDKRYVSMQKPDGMLKVIDLRTFSESTFRGKKYGMSEWMPDSKFVVFGNYYLYNSINEIIVNAETMQQADLEVHKIYWLANGWIAYAVERENGYHLEFRNLYNGTTYDVGVLNASIDPNVIGVVYLKTSIETSISPDNRYVVALLNSRIMVVLSLEDGTRQIRDTNVDFWSEDSLYWGPVTWPNYNLVWSPDSSKLAFVELVNSEYHLIILDKSGVELQRVMLPANLNRRYGSFLVWTQCP